MQVSILSTSDVHGYVMPDDFRRPYAEKKFGLSKSVTALEHDSGADVTIRIENGDFIQGSPLTDYVKQTNQLDVFKKLVDQADYDVQILGNHEFNYGRDFLETFYADNELLLNANIVDTVTGEPFIGKPYRVIEENGVKVAIIGVTTKYIPNWETSVHIAGLTFLDPVETVSDIAKNLRDEVDVIVVAYHGGIERDVESGELTEDDTGENQGYALTQIPEVDAVVTGHQHRKIAAIINDVPLTQPGYRGESVGVINLELDNERNIVAKQAELVTVSDLTVDKDITELIEPLQLETNEWLDTPIATLSSDMLIHDHLNARLNSHPYLELVNEVQMDVGNTQIASTALFNDEVQGLSKVVTRRDIMTNYIYPNEVVVQRLTGQDIKDALEVNAGYFVLEDNDIQVNPKYIWPKVSHYNYDIWSGIQYSFDIRKPFGQRVVELNDLTGEPLQMNATYEVAMNQYRSTGAGGFDMFDTSKTIREIPGSMTDHLISYMSEHGDALMPRTGHITVIK